jgi:hypothetical protein
VALLVAITHRTIESANETVKTAIASASFHIRFVPLTVRYILLFAVSQILDILTFYAFRYDHDHASI